MKQAKYNGRIVASIDIYNEYGVEIPELIDELKVANSKHLLKCIDTDIEVIFCFGEKNIPHFKYVKGTHINVTSESGYESKGHENGIEIIYQYLRKFYFGFDIYMNKKLNIGRRANILIDTKPSPIIIEYVVKIGKYSSWKDKCDEYLANGLNAIWIIDSVSIDEDARSNYDFNNIEYQLGRYDKNGRIYVLDRGNRELIVEKYIEFDVDEVTFSRKLFIMKFKIDQIGFNLQQGFSLKDFDESYEQDKKKFIEECQTGYNKIQRKELRHIQFAQEQESIRYSQSPQKDYLLKPDKNSNNNNHHQKYSFRTNSKLQNYTYDKMRYRKLLIDQFKNIELLSEDVFELMSYIRTNIDAFIAVFPDRQVAIRKVNKHLGSLNIPNDRIPFVEFEKYLKSLKY